jgi:hypothetical protein
MVQGQGLTSGDTLDVGRYYVEERGAFTDVLSAAPWRR